MLCQHRGMYEYSCFCFDLERKSISDLFQSFSSGRLYAQVVELCRHYESPILLFEFDEDGCFALQSAQDIPQDVSPYNIISKLTLLFLHFPQLRVIWSRFVRTSLIVVSFSFSLLLMLFIYVLHVVCFCVCFLLHHIIICVAVFVLFFRLVSLFISCYFCCDTISLYLRVI